MLVESDGDTTRAVVTAGPETMMLGGVPRDAEPSFSPSGRRGVLPTADGLMLVQLDTTRSPAPP